MGAELALAASARDWPDSLHRFLVDHGGARVRSRVMGADQALVDQFDVLIIDDICSFLSPRLVRSLRAQGKEVIGVFDPVDGSDAKRHLLECGISDVIELDASPEEFVALVAATVIHRTPLESFASDGPLAHLIGVFGCRGSGVTEVAVAISARLAVGAGTVLVDLDLDRPALAQRLDLPTHPNLLSAVDYAHHEEDRVADSFHRVGSLTVVTGVPPTLEAGRVSTSELAAFVQDLRAGPVTFVVIDAGEDPSVLDLDSFDLLIAVGEASPVGLTRLVSDVTALSRREIGGSLLTVVNRAPVRSRRSDEVRREVRRVVGDVRVVLIPFDRHVERAAWDGRPVDRGRLGRAGGRLADLLAEGVSA